MLRNYGKWYIHFVSTSLTSIDFTNFRVPKLRTLQNAFYKSSSLKSVNLSSVETDDLRNLGETFYDCHSIEYIYLPKNNYKNGVLMSGAFTNCKIYWFK